VVIFPWNIAKEISKQILADCPDTKIWIAVPNLTRIN
jgi:hypothetical protein